MYMYIKDVSCILHDTYYICTCNFRGRLAIDILINEITEEDKTISYPPENINVRHMLCYGVDMVVTWWTCVLIRSLSIFIVFVI